MNTVHGIRNENISALDIGVSASLWWMEITGTIPSAVTVPESRSY